MAQLIVRNLPEQLVRRLKRRAADHGRSTEAEHREILREALAGDRASVPSLKDMLLAMPSGGRDADFRRPRTRTRRVRL
jgi:plasmid stability protein